MLSPFLICLISLILHHVCASCNVEMISREEWGAREPRSTETMNMPVPHIFIHHTVTSACSSLESCSRVMRSMQNYHMDDKGWNDIGYNFVIGGDGRVYIGRGWNRVGAHTYGFNRNAVAFSLIGDFTNYAPPANMLMTTKKMIQCAKNEGFLPNLTPVSEYLTKHSRNNIVQLWNSYVTDDFKIHGHRDGACTECPGQALYDIIKTWENFEGGPLPGYSCRRS